MGIYSKSRFRKPGGVLCRTKDFEKSSMSLLKKALFFRALYSGRKVFPYEEGTERKLRKPMTESMSQSFSL